MFVVFVVAVGFEFRLSAVKESFRFQRHLSSQSAALCASETLAQLIGPLCITGTVAGWSVVGLAAHYAYESSNVNKKKCGIMNLNMKR